MKTAEHPGRDQKQYFGMMAEMERVFPPAKLFCSPLIHEI